LHSKKASKSRSNTFKKSLIYIPRRPMHEEGRRKINIRSKLRQSSRPYRQHKRSAF
jgi:hypothetical protein